MNLTPTGRITVGILIAALLGLGYYFFQPKLKESLESPTMEAVTGNNNSSESSSVTNNDNVATSTAPITFDYTAPEPINGKLKGVVELGASGFNSFIVTIDAQKRWKLTKADFGNSLVQENMATDDDIRIGLKKYIGNMLDYGVGGKDIHFVVSSGATKADVTQKIIAVLRKMGYFVNTVTPEQEGIYGLKCAMPTDFEGEAFVADIGSGNTKISWKTNGTPASVESFGAKYFEKNTDDEVYTDVKAKCGQVPTSRTKKCFIIGGVPFELAKQVRIGKERFTILKAPADYTAEKAKTKAGLNIYKAVKDATNCQQFIFDWDANFTIGFLLSLP